MQAGRRQIITTVVILKIYFIRGGEMGREQEPKHHTFMGDISERERAGQTGENIRASE